MIGLKRFSYIFPLVLSIMAAVPAFSQPPGGGADQSQLAQNSQAGQQTPQAGGQMQQGVGGRQGFGQGQGQQSEQMWNTMNQRLKQLMGSTDEEWTVIGPKILKVYTLISSQTRGVQVRALMDTSNQTRAGNNQASSNSSGDKTLEELQTLVTSEDATTTQIKSKMSEVRAAKEKSRQELSKAQKELRELLSLKQEAILISVGLLE